MTENKQGMSPKEAEFRLDEKFAQQSLNVQIRYHQLLLDRKSQDTKERGVEPLGVADRENLLDEAIRQINVEENFPGLNLRKTNKRWTQAHKGGRPPIGGAQND